MWKTILKYVIEYVLEFAKRVLPAIEEIVLEEIKDTLREGADFLAGDTFTEAKVKLVDEAFNRINLPLLLKPFKGLIKKALVKKLDEALEMLLHEIREKAINN